MKKALVLLLMTGLLFRVAAQQANAPLTQPVASVTNDVRSDEGMLRRLAQEWRDIYNGTDAGKFAALYAPEAEYISGHVEGLVAKGRGSESSPIFNVALPWVAIWIPSKCCR